MVTPDSRTVATRHPALRLTGARALFCLLTLSLLFGSTDALAQPANGTQLLIAVFTIFPW